MKKTMTSIAFAFAMTLPIAALAAKVTNLDNVTHTLSITEGENQIELNIGPGETIDICPDGCFVTMPNGDREVLTGNETLQIEANRGRVF